MSSVLEALGQRIEPRPVSYPSLVVVAGILNTHTHPRGTDEDGDGRAELTIPLWAEVADDIVAIGNTATPLTTTALALPQKQRWQALVPHGSPMRIHVAGLITENTDPADVVAGYDRPDGEEVWLSMKMFIRSASNSHNADVDKLSKMIPVLKAMTETKFVHKKRPMALSLHLERKWNVYGQRINFLLREQESVRRDLLYLLQQVPNAHLIVCHVSDASTIEIIRELRTLGYNVWGEICPHYTIWTCDDLFEGPGGGTAFDTCKFCLPIFKTEADRRAILSAMLSGEHWWIYGSDGACWLDDPTKPGGVKINSAGFVIGGQTQIERANMSYIIQKFTEAGKLEYINGFVSHNGRDAIGLPRSKAKRRFIYKEWKVDKIITRTSPTLGELSARVAMADMEMFYTPDNSIFARQ